MNRYGLRDDQWERIEHPLPGKPGDVGVTARDNRRFVEAVLDQGMDFCAQPPPGSDFLQRRSLQRAGLPAQILDLLRSCGSRGVAGQAVLAGLQKISLTNDNTGSRRSPRSGTARRSCPRRADLKGRCESSPLRKKCRRVERRISLTTCSAGFFTGPGFCAPSMATMGQKSL